MSTPEKLAPQYSSKSAAILATCHPFLQRVMTAVLRYYDHTIIEGHRDQVDQDADFAAGRSRLKWPHGKHNAFPSNAVDTAPYPVRWPGPLVVNGKLDKQALNDTLRFYHFAGFVQGTARANGIKLRWGGDWNSNHEYSDELGLRDLPHFEIDFDEL